MICRLRCLPPFGSPGQGATASSLHVAHEDRNIRRLSLHVRTNTGVEWRKRQQNDRGISSCCGCGCLSAGKDGRRTYTWGAFRPATTRNGHDLEQSNHDSSNPAGAQSREPQRGGWGESLGCRVKSGRVEVWTVVNIFSHVLCRKDLFCAN